MLGSYDALVVAKIDTKEALRLLSALVMGWDFIPVANQGRLIRDACLINGDKSANSLPANVLAFVLRHKDRQL